MIANFITGHKDTNEPKLQPNVKKDSVQGKHNNPKNMLLIWLRREKADTHIETQSVSGGTLMK